MFYESLGNRARGEIVSHLSAAGPLSTAQIEQRLGVTRGTAIEHLNRLEEQGLVVADTPRDERHGRTVAWSVSAERRDALLRSFAEYLRGKTHS